MATLQVLLDQVYTEALEGVKVCPRCGRETSGVCPHCGYEEPRYPDVNIKDIEAGDS